MDLHYSQTVGWNSHSLISFHYLMDLHYSQTSLPGGALANCFTTLWIYTILKPRGYADWTMQGFTTLWIYTILKQAFGNH